MLTGDGGSHPRRVRVHALENAASQTIGQVKGGEQEVFRPGGLLLIRERVPLGPKAEILDHAHVGEASGDAMKQFGIS
jgi:hypothetical protein